MQAFLDGKGSLFAVLCVAFTCIAAYGQTGVRPVSRTGDVNLARPARILVYNFAVSEAEVTEAHGILRQQPTIEDPVERGRRSAGKSYRCWRWNWSKDYEVWL